MSEKTVISCDSDDCCHEYEHHGGDFVLSDLMGWLYDQENEFHYCPSCVQTIRREFDDEGREYEIL